MIDYLKYSLVIGLVLAGWLGRGWYDDSNRLAIERAIAQTREAAQQAAADEIAKIEIKNTTTVKTIYSGTYTDPNYTDCRHTEKVWLDIQELFKPIKKD